MVLTFKNLKIHPHRCQVSHRNQEVELTTREFDVLFYLACHAGHVLTVHQIYEAVSGESEAYDYHSIENSIYSIWKKLRRDVILTVRDMGINLIGNSKGWQWSGECALLPVFYEDLPDGYNTISRAMNRLLFLFVRLKGLYY